MILKSKYKGECSKCKKQNTCSVAGNYSNMTSCKNLELLTIKDRLLLS